jgi:hypothetical protein
METPFGIKPGDSLTSKHPLSGWCTECGRRRGADARCSNCEPWWTSPLVQAGIPAVLGALFLMTSVSALIKQTEKPRETAAVGSTQLVKVIVPRPKPQMRTPQASVMSSYVAPANYTVAPPLRAQREGAYINSIIRMQDEAQRTQMFAVQRRKMASELQERMQSAARMRAQNQYLPVAASTPMPMPTNKISSVSPRQARLEEVMTEETFIAPL